MSLQDIVKENALKRKLEMLSKSIPKSRIKKAIKALELLASKKMFAEQERQQKAITHELFGQKTCGSCGTKHHHRSNCWNCYINSP